MENKLTGNISICKKVVALILVILFCLMGLATYTNKHKEITNRSLLANTNSKVDKIDISTLSFKAVLNKLTNIKKYNDLKVEFAGKTGDEINKEAISRGIIVEQKHDEDNNLEIGVNLDFSKLDITKFGKNASDSISLEDINLDNLNLGTKSLEDLNISGGEIKTEYGIGLKENPVTDDSSSVPKDVVILVDARMDGNTASQMLNGLDNCMFNTSTFTEGSGKLNFKEIPFHSKLKDKDYYALCNHNNDRDDLQQMAGFISRDFNSNNVDSSPNSLNYALEQAKTFFDNLDEQREANGEDKAGGKTIILLSKNIDEAEYNKCDIKNSYNVITICVSSMEYGQSPSDLAKDYNSYLKKIHTELGGTDSTYYVSNNTQHGGDGTHNDIQSPYMSADGYNIMQRVAKDLSWLKYNKSVSIEAALNFNPGEDITTFSKNVTKLEDGRFSVSMPQIRLKSDYVILSEDYNFIPGEDFVDDIILEFLNNDNKSTSVKVENIKEFLEDRLKNIDIEITNDEISEIVGDIYTAKLDKTIDQINTQYSNIIFNNANSIFSSTQYDAVKNKSVADILRSQNTDYAKLKEILMDILRQGIPERLNNALSYAIEEKFDIGVDTKNKIIDGIVNNVSVTSIIKELTGEVDSDVDKLITTIKAQLFEIQVNNLVLSNTAKGELSSNPKVKDVLLNNGVSNTTKEEIKTILRQKLNKYLLLTKTNYIVENEDESSSFIIEPTAKAAFSEAKSKLEFKKNVFNNGGECTGNNKNNYIGFLRTDQETTSGDENLINSTPIINVKRILINKEHFVYGNLGPYSTDDDTDIIAALKADNSGEAVFAKDSMVTFAINIIGLTDERNIKLKIDPKIDEDNTSDVQKPRIYEVQNNQGNSKKLNWICDMEKKNGVYEVDNFLGNNHKNIIILYSILLREKSSSPESTYTNNVQISGFSKGDGDVSVKAADKLPDLF